MKRHVQLCVLTLTLLPFLHAQTSAGNNALFIFGDSVFDVGNNNYINTIVDAQANFWPYGMTFFHSSTGRFSDGRLIRVCDFIAEYANLPLIPPFLQPDDPIFHDGVNFASAGAGALVESFQGKVINLHMQLKNYKKVNALFRDKFGNVGARRRVSKAVHFVSVGIDDYLALFLSNSTFTDFTAPEYVNMVIGNITSVITEIYRTGGRKFEFLNVPQVACLPELRNLNVEGNGDCLNNATSYAMLHNEALYNTLEQLRVKLPGFKYSLYDLYTHLQQMIDQPSKYGFKEGKTACCGTGEFRGISSCGRVEDFELCQDIDDYVFWDSTHLTEKAHNQFANEMWMNTNSTLSYGQYNIKDLFCLPYY